MTLPLLKPECVVVPLGASSAVDAISALVDVCYANSMINDPEMVKGCMLERENARHTVCFDGIAIPRACCEGIAHPILAIARLETPIEWIAGGMVSVVIMMGMPAPKDTTAFLSSLVEIAKQLKTEQKRESLKAAASAADLWDIWTNSYGLFG